MSAKGAMERVRRNDSTLSNEIPPTKRGRRKSSSASASKWGGDGDAPLQPGAGKRKVEPDLVSRDHCCGIHGAARERKGRKRGTSAARRRHEKELIRGELEEVI